MFNKHTREEVEFIAEQYGWNPASLLAVVEVESAGIYEWNVRGVTQPPIRFEGHYFHRRLKGARLREAVAKGLAHPRLGGVKNPRSYAGRYDLLARARAVDDSAALESTSMGVGQVMGLWWKELGYDSPQKMFARARSGLSGQVELMARYIDMAGLGKYVTGPGTLVNFTAFAKGYNGVAYKRNAYHEQMWEAYRRWDAAPKTASGAKQAAKEYTDEYMAGIKADLKTLGYVDVKKFQRDHGIVVDGKPGPMTREAITEAISIQDRKQSDAALKAGTGTMGVSLGTEAGQTVLEKVTDIQATGLTGIVIDVVVGLLTVAGIGLLLYGLYKQFKARDN